MFYTSNEQMKGNIFLCLLVYIILRMEMKVKKYIRKCILFTFIFQSSISQKIMLLVV